MRIQIINDDSLHDTFVHLPSWICNRFKGLEDPILKLVDVTNSNVFYAFISLSPISLLKSGASSYVPSGEYFISSCKLDKEELVVLQAESFKDYESMAKNADEIVNHLFLDQIRVVQSGRTIKLWINSSEFVLLRATLKDQVQTAALVGIDTVLEIVPPASVPLTLSKRMRVRQLFSDSCEMVAVVNPYDLPSKTYRHIYINGIKVPIYVSTDVLPEWIHLSYQIISKLGLKQHQWIDFKVDSDILQEEKSSQPTILDRIPRNKEFDEFEGTLSSLHKQTDPLHGRGLLLQGESKVGKTHLCQDFCLYGNVPAVYIDWRGKQIQNHTNAKEVMDRSLKEVLDLRPCVIFIDHAAELVGNRDESLDEEQQLQNEILCHHFIPRADFIMKVLACPIVLVCNESDLSEILVDSSLWSCSFTIYRPEVDKRLDIICNAIQHRGEKKYLSKDLDANALQMQQLLERTKGLLPIHVVSAASGLCPPLEGERPQYVVADWIQIVGMDEVKRQLTQELVWPIKFRDFFKLNGFTHSVGVLLHGRSGTGKSYIVHSLINSLSEEVNVIYFSGPSILGKYVGSSEKAIREIFQRARSRTPALIVIEEADSVMPIRGRDSSGILDRVVNQFLTELDGIEKRENVHILAVTRVPDAIDPAILRSGRISTQICVDVPGLKSRFQILRFYCSHLAIDEAILEELARETEGMTPADLIGIVQDFVFQEMDGNPNRTPSQWQEAMINSCNRYKCMVTHLNKVS